MIRRLIIRLLCCLTLSAPGCLTLSAPAFAGSAEPVSFERSELTIVTAAGTRYRFDIEVAKTEPQLQQGLMFRDSLAADAGMLFLLGTEEMAAFWMRNTFLPLDMLFIAGDGRITNIHRDAAPGSTSIITSTAPVIAVLELNAGVTGRLHIAPGDRVVYPAFH
ncbi:MAG: DUF192 domain-containing protein [Rhodospirillaceae bacterium]